MTTAIPYRNSQILTMAAKTILLINSEANLCELLQDCLIHLGGWQVSITGSPAEGLQYAIQEQPDAIVFDLCTFGMNFFTFLKKLRAQPATRDIPVVLITTGVKWLDLEPLKQFQLAGVLDYSANPAKLPSQLAAVLNWQAEPSLPGKDSNP